jgi:uncharacterized protein YpiB (UPF0302 family)
MLKAKQEAILHFIRTPLKHPMSKFALQFLLDKPGLLEKVSFVRNREFLPNTMLVSELGSPRIGFELSLGACQREEVSIVNGQLIRQMHRHNSLCINDPLEAIHSLHNFQGQLYVVLSFCGNIPAWYEQVVEPNPAWPEAGKYIDHICTEIIREQIELAILAITTRVAIDKALTQRDEAAFRQHAVLYRQIMQRCLWEFE